MKRRLFARLILGSVRRRWGRAAVAFAAVMLAATLVSTALSVSTAIGERTGRALRAYGANIVIQPGGSGPAGSGEGYLTTRSLEALSRLPSASAIQGVVPLLFAVARAGSAPVVLVGTDLAAARAINSWWQLRPDVRTPPADSAVVGVNLAQALTLKTDDRITVRVGTRRATLTVAALLTSGGAEDNQLIVDLPLAQRLTGKPGLASLAQVSTLSRSGDVSGIVSEIAAALPTLRVQSIRQVAAAEGRLLRRVELLLALIAAVVVLAAGVSVSATMSALAVERRGEVALMKAIGARDGTVSGLFLLEAGAIGIGGGLGGYSLGWLLAQLVGRAMWASSVPVDGRVLLITVATAGILAVTSGILPVRRALAVEPAVVLRGE